MKLPKRISRKSGRDGRLRSPSHLRWIRGFECCAGPTPLCEGPIEAAHVRIGTDGGVSLKPGDQWAISLCARHHRLQHQIGEAEFEKEHCIDMKALAREFAKRSPHLRKLERTGA